MKLAFTFWHDLRRCVDTIAETLGAEELSEDAISAFLHFAGEMQVGY